MIHSQLSMQIAKFPAMNNIIEGLKGGGGGGGGGGGLLESPECGVSQQDVSCTKEGEAA